MPSCRLLAALALCAAPALARSQTSHLALPGGPTPLGVLPAGARVNGIPVVVRLVDAPLATVAGENGKRGTSALVKARLRAQRDALRASQDEVSRVVRALGGRELGRMRTALAAVLAEVPSRRLAELAATPGVASVRPITDYRLDLSETVPYVGGTALHAASVTGRGVRVAVLDSGIDYLHADLGGSGSVAEYQANDPEVIEPGSFPTAKVVGGFDFVGPTWPDTDLLPDPDPLDAGSDAGHGTHVADIIAGARGVAPGASLYAVKVCSSVSTACSGVALLQGVEFALDPDGDGELSDAVDVMNLSLGSPYGQREDDLSAALANAVRVGVVVVASAGNSGDRPFITGSPSTTPELISVAQTQVPAAKLYRIDTPAASAGGSWQTWSAAPALVTGPLQYGLGANVLGCDSFPAGSLTGRIVLLDRGTCAVSIKVSNVAAAGGLAAVVANNLVQGDADLPPDFSFGGGEPTVAGYSIMRSEGLRLRAAAAAGAIATIDPATAVSLLGNMVSTSSRGPSMSFAAIKPDLGAPGASVSAEFGTGTERTAFGGTSGAAPMVSGAAALLLQAFPSRAPAEIKALLMNTAEPAIGTNPVAAPGVGAPITRLGGGELRVDAAFAARTAAWDAEALAGSLSFGYRSVHQRTTLERRVVVRNYAPVARDYAVTTSFRYPDDAAGGAVTLEAPARVRVPANGSRSFTVRVSIDPSRLPTWTVNGGNLGGDGFRLRGVEADGYVSIADATDSIRLAWQVLPHRSADVEPSTEDLDLAGGTGTVTLSNEGAIAGRVEVFSYTGRSPRLPPAAIPVDGSNVAVTDLRRVGVRLATPTVIQFAVSTFGRRAHPAYPAEFDVFVDSNRDGRADFIVFNRENGAFATTGQTVVAVFDVAAGAATAFFFADADLESGNVILTAPLAALGLTPGTPFDFGVGVFDNYFSGFLTDWIGLNVDPNVEGDFADPMTYTAGTPRFAASAQTVSVPVDGTASLAVTAPAGGGTASPSQRGLLLMYRDGREDRESETIDVTP